MIGVDEGEHPPPSQTACEADEFQVASKKSKIRANWLSGIRLALMQHLAPLACSRADAVRKKACRAACHQPAEHASPFSSPCFCACARQRRTGGRTRTRSHTCSRRLSRRMRTACRCPGNAGPSPCCETAVPPDLPARGAEAHHSAWEELCKKRSLEARGRLDCPRALAPATLRQTPPAPPPRAPQQGPTRHACFA